MFQLGEFSNQDLVAASTPMGLGYSFKDRPWKPQVWAYYDWASGDPNPGQGDTNSTFEQLFPFGHYYFGYLDLVGRKNIQDAYFQFVCFPENWLTLLVQYHNFWLAEERDALYNAAGVPLRQDLTGAAGNYVGNEIDLLLSARADPAHQPDDRLVEALRRRFHSPHRSRRVAGTVLHPAQLPLVMPRLSATRRASWRKPDVSPGAMLPNKSG